MIINKSGSDNIAMIITVKVITLIMIMIEREFIYSPHVTLLLILYHKASTQ